ncbi:MAG: ATP-binding protein, partial [Thermoleophilaceae bacterium]
MTGLSAGSALVMTARTAISGPTDAWAALVERDGEYEAIDRALTRAVLGHGPLVLLYGQAGVGRSALLRAAIRDAQQRGFAVLRAAGSDMERGYGFGVLRQLLEAHIAELTKAQRRSLLGYAGPSAEAALGLGPFDKRAS